MSNIPISIVENQTFTGVSSVSAPVSIGNWINGSDWTLCVTVSGCFAGTVLVSVEDSADAFVDDVRVVVAFEVTGPVNPGTFVGYSWRARELPSYRVGQSNASSRISVTSQNSGASVTLSVAEIK